MDSVTEKEGAGPFSIMYKDARLAPRRRHTDPCARLRSESGFLPEWQRGRRRCHWQGPTTATDPTSGILSSTYAVSLLSSNETRISNKWRFGSPRREEYIGMLEEYKEHLEAMQRELAEELEAVRREIEELRGT